MSMRGKKLYCLFSFTTINKAYGDSGINNHDISQNGSTKPKENKDLYSFNCHTRILAVFLMILWALALYRFGIENHSEIGPSAVIGYAFVSVVIAYAFARCIYMCCRKKTTKRFDEKKGESDCCKYVMFFVSPSWYFADLFKNKFEPCKRKENDENQICGKTLLIAYLNRWNLILSAAIAFIAYYFCVDYCIGFFTTFVVVRTLSRSFEITYAFGKDILETKKNSLLEPHQRLILAFASLIECILNYSVAYYLVSQLQGLGICKWQSFEHSFQSGLFYSNKLLEDGLSLFHPTTLTMLQMTQVVTCMTLVFLAFASYMSNFISGGGKGSDSKVES